MKRAAGELHVPHLAPLPPAPAKLPAGTAAELANKARQELARGKFDAALALAQRAVDKAPHRAGLHIVLGDVLRLRGDVRAAALQYELAKRLGPQLALDDDRVLPANPF